ncbi:MAG: HEAT repeat domain-containing protein, partial [Chitinophagaceae bacterium]|nr:HEAT repeat domain-containing protein [Chitinophagaceae bacterium]
RKYIHLLWVLQRLNGLSPAMLQAAIERPDPLIRLHAIRILGEKKPDYQSLFPLLLKGLSDSDPHVKRASVELLAMYPSMHSLQLALQSRYNIPEYETHLLYATRLSLRNILRRDSIMKSTAAVEWNESDAAAISDVLMGVPSEQAGIFLFRYLKKFQPAPGRAPSIFKHIARFAPGSLLDSMIMTAMNGKRADSVNLLVFKGIQEGFVQRGQKENSRLGQWGRSLAEDVLKSNPYHKEASVSTINLQTFAADVAGKYNLNAAVPSLEAILKDLSTRDLMLNGIEISDELLGLKASALRALIKIDQEKGLQVALRILNDNTSDPVFRNTTGRILGEFPGSVVNRVLKEVKNAPPDLQAGIALTLANTSAGKDILFAKVKNREMFARTLTQPKIQERLLLNISPAQEKVFKELTAGLPPVDKERQDEIYKRVLDFEKAMNTHPPSVDSGRIVFMQNCSPCHSIAENGGDIGPNLDGVSQWGAKALAEKILDPNRNISENFRTYTIKTKDGKILSGLYRREEGASIIFADLSGSEFSISKQNIAEQTASRLTLMPDNFRETLSEKEFNQLIHFLIDPKGLKSKN